MIISLEDFAAEWVLESLRLQLDQNIGQKDPIEFRVFVDSDGTRWWIWRRHFIYPNNKTDPVLLPFTLERCVQDWGDTVRSLERLPDGIKGPLLSTQQHRIRNVNTGEVIPCAAL